jgi:hypothetical protein
VNTLLRSLIVWLLMLALPWQGAAAAAMAACGPAPAQHQQHRPHDGARPPCHESAMAAHTAHSVDKQEKQAHAGAAKCAHCAACSIGAAALPASLPPLVVHAPPAAAPPAADSRLPSVHLAQPERPPRPRLA